MRTHARRIVTRQRAVRAVEAITLLDSHGVTVERLAALVGVSPRSIYRWWHKEAVPQPGHFERLCRIRHEAQSA